MESNIGVGTPQYPTELYIYTTGFVGMACLNPNEKLEINENTVVSMGDYDPHQKLEIKNK